MDGRRHGASGTSEGTFLAGDSGLAKGCGLLASLAWALSGSRTVHSTQKIKLERVTDEEIEVSILKQPEAGQGHEKVKGGNSSKFDINIMSEIG